MMGCFLCFKQWNQWKASSEDKEQFEATDWSLLQTQGTIAALLLLQLV